MMKVLSWCEERRETGRGDKVREKEEVAREKGGGGEKASGGREGKREGASDDPCIL